MIPSQDTQQPSPGTLLEHLLSAAETASAAQHPASAPPPGPQAATPPATQPSPASTASPPPPPIAQRAEVGRRIDLLERIRKEVSEAGLPELANSWSLDALITDYKGLMRSSQPIGLRIAHCQQALDWAARRVQAAEEAARAATANLVKERHTLALYQSNLRDLFGELATQPLPGQVSPLSTSSADQPFTQPDGTVHLPYMDAVAAAAALHGSRRQADTPPEAGAAPAAEPAPQEAGAAMPPAQDDPYEPAQEQPTPPQAPPTPLQEPFPPVSPTQPFVQAKSEPSSPETVVSSHRENGAPTTVGPVPTRRLSHKARADATPYGAPPVDRQLRQQMQEHLHPEGPPQEFSPAQPPAAQ